ncbi:Dos2-interacting transcription regulator of RNA-Pol-II-domain-containing protein [Xylogone sp. PMI_703]|nr:Dos2-interacting transcription regulator of RNA-Pol-II-domain-containing protein [Xylogone sp. PMI_703]
MTEERTVAEWMSATSVKDKEDMSSNIAQRFDQGTLAPQIILRDLQQYISEDASLTDVAKGLELFTSVLTRMQNQLNSRQDVHLLVEYFCNRLHNTDEILSYRAGLKEVLTSLSLLAKMDNKFIKSDSAEIVKAMFAIARRDTLREQKAATRLVLFQLLDMLFKKYKSTLYADIGRDEYASGLVSIAEFEKDPSCLSILFQMYADLGPDLSHASAKNIWESYIRYFPIKMGGNARDESKPSIDHLKVLLLQCFVSSDLYAEWAFPRLIEQLDIDQDLTANVKLDVLETMATCAATYSPQVAQQWSTKVYDALKFEVLNGTNEDFIEGTLKVFRSMTKTLQKLSQDWNNEDDVFVRYVVDICRQCIQRLHEPERRFVRPCGRILAAIASTSPIAFSIVIKSTVSVLLVIWQDLDSTKDRKQFLDIFNYLLRARLEVGEALDKEQNISDPNKLLAEKEAMISALSVYQERLIEIYFGAITQEMSTDLEDAQYRIETIKGLTLLVQIPNFLAGYAKNTVFDVLTTTALDVKLDQKIHDESISALETISIEDPEAFRDIVLRSFLHKLPDSVSSEKATQKEEIRAHITVIEGITRVACTSTCKIEFSDGAPLNAITNYKYRLFDEFQTALLKKLTDAVLTHKGQIQYAKILLAAVFRGLEMFDHAINRDEEKGDILPDVDPKTGPYTWIVQLLYRLVTKQKQNDSDPDQWYIGLRELPITEGQKDDNDIYDDFFVHLVGKIATLALRSRRTTPLNNFLLNYDEAHPDEPSQIWGLFRTETAKGSLMLPQQHLLHGPADKCTANILSMSLIAGLRREDKSRLRINIGDTTASMFRNAISTTSQASVPARIAILEFMQLLINKFAATKESITNDERKLIQIVKDEVEDSQSKSEEETNNVYQTLAYFTAAALARYDETTPTLIQLMLDELTSATRGRRVAQSFRILLAPSPTMNEQNHCIIRPLRIGRLFELVVPRIISIWKESNVKDVKVNCSVALAAVLSYMPESLLTSHATETMPLILEGTNVPNDDQTQMSSIEILIKFVADAPKVIEEHLDSLISRMTARTHNAVATSAACRVKAVDCLTTLPKHLRSELLLQRRPRLYNELNIALGDSSREVRFKAGVCKMAWFALDEKTSE